MVVEKPFLAREQGVLRGEDGCSLPRSAGGAEVFALLLRPKTRFFGRASGYSWCCSRKPGECDAEYSGERKRPQRLAEPRDLIDIVPEVVPGYPDRILPKNDAAAAELRTLTNLYNARPQWLADEHCDLDAAVAAAYGWPADISEEDALVKLLELNLSRAAANAASSDDEDGSDGD